MNVLTIHLKSGKKFLSNQPGDGFLISIHSSEVPSQTLAGNTTHKLLYFMNIVFILSRT